MSHNAFLAWKQDLKERAQAYCDMPINPDLVAVRLRPLSVGGIAMNAQSFMAWTLPGQQIMYDAPAINNPSINSWHVLDAGNYL